MQTTSRKLRGFQSQKQRKMAIVLISAILIELLIAFCLLILSIFSAVVFKKVSLFDFVAAIAAIGCVGVTILAVKKLSAALA